MAVGSDDEVVDEPSAPLVTATAATAATAGAASEVEARRETPAEAETPASPETPARAPVPPPRPLRAPRDGVPPVVADQAALDTAVAALAAQPGPVAVDAERASGYRYGQRAYLVQLRRGTGPTVLVDPVAGLDLTGLASLLDGPEWVLHAASQDLPCLAEIGLRPRALFDTELAARIAHLPRVGLAAVAEHVLDVSLAKEHSAVDWSRRPLPEPWLVYAALDVELLVELRDELEALLAVQGKLGWAREEFAAVVAAPPPEPRPEPWRRTSGSHKLRDRRRLAAVRELWRLRDDIARQRDLSPTRVLPDAAIVAAAERMPETTAELAELPVFSGPANRRLGERWLGALDRARRLPPSQLPGPPPRGDGPPAPRTWADRDPAAAARLTAVRATLATLAERHDLPLENLLTPDTGRRLAWDPPQPASTAAVAGFLRGRGAREWQVGLCAGPLAAAIAAAGDGAVAVDGGDVAADRPSSTTDG